VEHREVGDLYRLLRAAVPLAMGIMWGGKIKTYKSVLEILYTSLTCLTNYLQFHQLRHYQL